MTDTTTEPAETAPNAPDNAPEPQTYLLGSTSTATPGEAGTITHSNYSDYEEAKSHLVTHIRTFYQPFLATLGATDPDQAASVEADLEAALLELNALGVNSPEFSWESPLGRTFHLSVESGD